MRVTKRTIALLLAVIMAFSVFAMISTASAVDIESGKILSADFSDFTGGAVSIYDGDGNIAATTAYGEFTATTGREGRSALALAGGNVNSANFPRWNASDFDPYADNDISNGITISMMVKYDSLANNSYIYSYSRYPGDATGSNGRWATYLKYDGGKLTAWTRKGSSSTTMEFRSPLVVTGRWLMITYVEQKDGQTDLYINGIKINATKTAKDTHYAVSQCEYTDDFEYAFGGFANCPWNDQAFKGAMESFEVYNRPLTHDEVIALYDESNSDGIVKNFVPLDTRNNTNSAATGTSNCNSWFVLNNVQIGNRIYLDRSGVSIESMPDYLVGSELISTAMSSKTQTGWDAANPFAKFTVSKKADVYLAVDSRAANGGNIELSDYDKLEDTLKVKGNTATYYIYRKTVEAGSEVTLPSQLRDDSNMYLAFVAAADTPVAADYSKVEEAIAAVPEDLSIYTEATAAGVTAAVNAVVYDLTSDKQDEVDAMAEAVNAAVAKLVLKSLEINIGISDGVVTEGDAGKYNITWNANVTLGADATLDEINANAVFKSYGVYYGTSEEAVNALAAGTESAQAKKLAISEGEDIDVYTIFGFRLKGVSADKIRAAKFYITYEYQGNIYTVLSDTIEAQAVIAE